MARHAILIATSDAQRLSAWHGLVRRAGDWPLPAPTLTRALWWMRKIRPAVVLVDAGLTDGRAAVLLSAMRALPRMGDAPVVVLGALTAEEHAQVAHDPYVVLWPAEHVADDTLARLLDDMLSGARADDDARPPSQTGRGASTDASWPRPAPSDV